MVALRRANRVLAHHGRSARPLHRGRGGGARVPVTKDAAVDWSPVWSPDGRFIYFSSDRGGAMNLWRIDVDQSTGRAEAPRSR